MQKLINSQLPQHVLNHAKSGDYLILNEMICFIKRKGNENKTVFWLSSRYFPLLSRSYTQNLETAEESKAPLRIVFCFQIDQRLIDENHKLTRDYLQRLTGDLH